MKTAEEYVADAFRRHTAGFRPPLLRARVTEAVRAAMRDAAAELIRRNTASYPVLFPLPFIGGPTL